jgi:hypothetical protein
MKEFAPHIVFPTLGDVMDTYPWATILIVVADGWMCFESSDDYCKWCKEER